MQQEYPASGYDDVPALDTGAGQSGGYYGNYGGIPTPAAVPHMMQPGQRDMGYGVPGAEPMLKGTPYQNIPQMEYGQSYGAKQQPDFTQSAPAQGGPFQRAARQPAAPQQEPAAKERDDLGIPAFLRRPGKK